MQTGNITPAPWRLQGKAYILLYHFTKNFSRKHGFLDPYQNQALKGWIGAVMIVDYADSDIGPYQELLFIPGLFRIKGRLTFSISKIYVSTYESVLNGHHNWGIPKKQADFKVTEHEDGSHTFDVGLDEHVFFHARIQPGGLGFPVSSRFLPFFRITQKYNDSTYRTRPRVTGRAELSYVRNLMVKPEYFPPVNQLNPIAVLHMKNFKMRFPKARIK